MTPWNNDNYPMSNDDYGSLPRTTQMSDFNYTMNKCDKCKSSFNIPCQFCGSKFCMCGISTHEKNCKNKNSKP